MARKTKAINKTAGFSIAANNTNIKAITDRPCWAVRTLRWLFIRMPRAVWRWICNIDIHGLCNLTLMLLIIIFFSILIGQILRPDCNKNIASNRIATKIPEITAKSQRNNVQIISNTVPDVVIRTQIKQNADVVIEEEKTIIIVPFKASRKSTILTNPKFIKVNGDIIIDGERVGRRLESQTYINGNLIIQNMNGFTLPCGVKVNGNLIVRNINSLNFCGDFTVNGDIYVSADSSFGPIPRNAHILGQIIF